MSLPKRHERVGELFKRAAGLPEAEREAFLRAECGDDKSLLNEVLQLLAADAESGPIGSSTQSALRMSFFGHQREQASPPMMGIEPGRVIDDFKLIALIGQGGMGQVWEAEQISFNQKVALKLMRPDRISSHTLDLFAREARAGGRLHHPGIVTVYDHGEHEGIAWISMELVEGSWTLHDFLDDAGEQDALSGDYYQKVARFAAQLADALYTAHEAGVIHRDLKPSNILITPDEHPKVSDFGLAKITDETAISQTGELAGSAYYMSPEQAMARRMGIDHRTDIFSLGVVMYELLALRRPFEGDTTQQIMRQIMLEDPVDPRQLRSRVPQDLAVISGKCMEKHPDRRYQSMAELAADIRRHLANESIAAKPPTAWQKGLKWVKRHPTTSVGASIGTSALVFISLLLAANMRTNKSLQAEIDSVLRLSALQDYDDLLVAADRLWPIEPDGIEAYVSWIQEGQELVDALPTHLAKREELRTTALLQNADEQQADRESNPLYSDYQTLAAETASIRNALLQRRDGVAAELPAVDWGKVPQNPRGLNALALDLIKTDRDILGEEARGLVIARQALDVAMQRQDDEQVAEICKTVALGLFALGRDDEAIAKALEAQDKAPEDKKAEFGTFLNDLLNRITTADSEDGLREAQEDLVQLEERLAKLEELVSERRTWLFRKENFEAGWWNNQLTKLIEALEGLADEETGLLGEGLSGEHGWGMARRLAHARLLEKGFAAGGEYALRWEQALPAMRKMYSGIQLSPTMGIVPISADRTSGLWEFWHILSGREPVLGSDGHLHMSPETGLVFVLLPGGTFAMGAKKDPREEPNYYAEARFDESPVHEVTLSPIFMSKFEMTQGQWERFTGSNPSFYKNSPESNTLDHPVESVTWRECMAVLPKMGLSLPSEAQWEYATRGGTTTPWWTGNERTSLLEMHAVNLADQAAHPEGYRDWPELDDGYAVHAPVGTFSANPFGLHEVHGNVWEWCLDYYDPYYYQLSQPAFDPVALVDRGSNVMRGGGFASKARDVHSAAREQELPSDRGNSQGVRPIISK